MQNPDGSSHDKNWSKGHSSLYDSGRTDSGFISGDNIQSEMLNSGEITPPIASTDNLKECTSKESYSRFDSGLDVEFTEQLSEMCIDDDKPNPTIEIDLPCTQNDDKPWLIYFDQDEDGDTLLHTAVIQECIDVVFSLIRLITDFSYLNLKNDMRQTALHLAVLTSQPKIARLLVYAGADTSARDHRGNTALHLAVSSGDYECVKALTEPVPASTVRLLELRYRPKSRKTCPEINKVNYDGLACVHIAALGRHVAILRQLVRNGADIDAKEHRDGYTALHIAVELEDQNLACILLKDLRADPEVPNYKGDTPYRCSRFKPSFQQVLIAFGAPEEDDYFSSDYDSYDETDEPELPVHNGFKNGGIVNATA